MKNNTALHLAVVLVNQEIEKVLAKDNLSSKKMTSRINMLHDCFVLLDDLFDRVAPNGSSEGLCDACLDEDAGYDAEMAAATAEIELLEAQRDELLAALRSNMAALRKGR